MQQKPYDRLSLVLVRPHNEACSTANGDSVRSSLQCEGEA